MVDALSFSIGYVGGGVCVAILYCWLDSIQYRNESYEKLKEKVRNLEKKMEKQP